MKEVLDKILAILEAQDAKIKALEAELKTYTGASDTLIDTIYADKDADWYNEFSGKHRAKFEPYLGLMDKLEGGDSFRAIYERTKDLSDAEGYDEDTYVNDILAQVVETIEGLKAIVPPEAKPALEEAGEAIKEASVTADVAESPTESTPEATEGPAEAAETPPDEWSEEELAKEKLKGKRLFE